MRFDPAKILLDPYGRGVVVPDNYSRDAASQAGANIATAMKSVVVDPSDYDWEGDEPLRRPSSQTIIYEMHVKGFTRHPNSGVGETTRGTFSGLIEKIPYLQRLGITAVELLPVFQFDAQDCPAGKVNYWGYAPVSFFAPHQAYSSRQDPLGPVDEFRDMVKALHRAGIEVILDVVFDHTAEGGRDGPTLCFRGLDNTAYYILEEDRAGYANYTGTGNTLNANHPIVRRMITDSLRYWVQEMHVDGFRFDLASILARGPSGQPIPNPPVLWDIDTDPALAGTKLFAEAWDAAGLYQVGSFIGDSWKEWNGRFRDDVRAFFRGEPGSAARVADRLVGSPNIYGHEEREAEQSVNFVTCHDGFTLNDLVSYNDKHNEANGEDNRDGSDENFSRNWGADGPTDAVRVNRMRRRLQRNFLATLILSQGVPMVLGGDEMGRTQNGNNNAYCQDNELSWVDWDLVRRNEDLVGFTRTLISLFHAHPVLRRRTFFTGRPIPGEMVKDLTWIRPDGQEMTEDDWQDENNHVIGMLIHGEATDEVDERGRPVFGDTLFLVLNGGSRARYVVLPKVEGLGSWRELISTASYPETRSIKTDAFTLAPHSLVLLVHGEPG
jgi:glycogen operon protein